VEGATLDWWSLSNEERREWLNPVLTNYFLTSYLEEQYPGFLKKSLEDWETIITTLKRTWHTGGSYENYQDTDSATTDDGHVDEDDTLIDDRESHISANDNNDEGDSSRGGVEVFEDGSDSVVLLDEPHIELGTDEQELQQEESQQLQQVLAIEDGRNRGGREAGNGSSNRKKRTRTTIN